ncbi:MAG: SCO family protein [Actinomycetota bacterium]
MTPASSGAGHHPVQARFELLDHEGRWVSEQSFRGDFMLVFFGFTRCKMVCPRALTRLSTALDILGPHAARIHPLYITVDPEHDSPNVMKAFLQQRFPRFTGLTGPATAIDEAKRSFHVFSRKQADPEDPSGYRVPHSAFTYLIGTDGQYVAHFSDAVDARDLAVRLTSLLA